MKIRLTQNMRAQNDKWYSNFLLRIGNRTEETYNDYVQLPDDIAIEYKSDQSLDILIERVFPDIKVNYNNAGYMHERAVLST